MTVATALTWLAFMAACAFAAAVVFGQSYWAIGLLVGFVVGAVVLGRRSR